MDLVDGTILGYGSTVDDTLRSIRAVRRHRIDGLTASVSVPPASGLEKKNGRYGVVVWSGLVWYGTTYDGTPEWRGGLGPGKWA